MTTKSSILLLLAVGVGLILSTSAKLDIPKLKLDIPKLQLLLQHEIPKLKLLKQQAAVMSAQNPRDSPACFAVYKPRLDNVAAVYEKEYNGCMLTYNQQIGVQDAKWQPQYNQLLQSGKSTCAAITSCSSAAGYVEEFECYAQMGAEESMSMFTISSSAAEVAVEIKDSYQAVESNKAICINSAERNYVEFTAATYEDLNACLAGKIDPISTEYTTTTKSTLGTTRATPSWTDEVTYSTWASPN